MPIFGVPQKLKEFHTSKKDINAGREVLPPENYRLLDEDIFDEEPRARHPTESVKSFNLDGISSSGSFDGDISALNNNMMKLRSDTMFQKTKSEEKVELSDFTLSLIHI